MPIIIDNPKIAICFILNQFLYRKSKQSDGSTRNPVGFVISISQMISASLIKDLVSGLKLYTTQSEIENSIAKSMSLCIEALIKRLQEVKEVIKMAILLALSLMPINLKNLCEKYAQPVKKSKLRSLIKKVAVINGSKPRKGAIIVI